jgi:excisionase family DNA binding protein
MPDNLLSIVEVAELCGVTVKAVYQAISRGSLRAIPPRGYVILREDAEAWDIARKRYHKRGKEDKE